MSPRIPAPSYRHASPSGPWPWMNIDSEFESDSTRSSHEEAGRFWSKYPQSLFPNWTQRQVERSGIKETIAESHTCMVHHVDVHEDGQFSTRKSDIAREAEADEHWESMQKELAQDIRVQALFVEKLSGPVLQMLGTKYNIEPFFFSSSLNWIPSRYQEELRPGQGDHITITLTFLRSMKMPTILPNPEGNRDTNTQKVSVDQKIDTQIPLPLSFNDPDQRDDEILLLDLLAIHMIRIPGGSTIISYHPSHDRNIPAQPHNSATRLYSRVFLAGQSVYWQHIFQKSDDPTFVLLTILWYALYAWDEAFETLWEYICHLELRVISTNDMLFTQELHKIRAHLLHYSSLLDDFRKSVVFVLETPNPAMDSSRYDEKARKISRELLKKEVKNLLMEIDRLSMSREMQEKRLKNVMNLVFSIVNIEDSKRMQALTETAARDSAAMKQIAYLNMVFLPASFCAGVFGMNIREINPTSFGTLAHYVEIAIPFTAVTIWIILAFQNKWSMGGSPNEISLWTHLSWPISSLGRLFGGRENGRQRNAARGFPEGFERMREIASIQITGGSDEATENDGAV